MNTYNLNEYSKIISDMIYDKNNCFNNKINNVFYNNNLKNKIKLPFDDFQELIYENFNNTNDLDKNLFQSYYFNQNIYSSQVEGFYPTMQTITICNFKKYNLDIMIINYDEYNGEECIGNVELEYYLIEIDKLVKFCENKKRVF